MNDTQQALWQTLQASGLVVGDQPTATPIDSPWYIKALQAVSGWLAALFLFAFIGFTMDLLDSPIASLVTGAVMIVGAFALLRGSENDFLEHIALAASMTGQLLVIYGIAEMLNSRDVTLWLLVLLMQSLLAVLMPHFIHRLLSAIFAAFSLLAVMADWGLGVLFEGLLASLVAWLWLHEFRLVKHMKAVRAIGYGLLLSAACLSNSVETWDIFYGSNNVEFPWLEHWMGSLLTAAVLILVVWTLLQRNHVSAGNKITWLSLSGTAVVSIASLEVWGLSTGLMILLLGFAASNRVMQGIGIVSLLYSASAYYYTLEITLLEKSQHLLIVGLLLIIARWIMQKALPAPLEKEHA